MTEPNYWIAAWLSVISIWIGFSLVRAALEDWNLGHEGLFAIMAFSINTVAALYCAGFIVMVGK